jgi:Putative peptidoglycan binding domain/HlyD family secretion protein
MTSEQSTGEVAADPPRAPGRRRRWRLAAAGGVVVIAAAAVTVGVTRPFGAPAAASHGIGDTATEPVTDQSLSEQTTANGSLGYAHSYNVVVAGSGQSSASGQGAAGTGSPAGAAGQGSASQGSGGSQPAGTFTWLPAVGKVVRQGHRLYSVNGAPVVLLYGAVPAYRSLSEGMSGADVRQLNGDLAALGYATRSALGPGSSYFGAATARAVGKLQARLGLTRTGSLSLGQAVFLPTAAKVSSVSASPGDPAQVGTGVLQATSTKRQVTAQLDATLQSDVKVGDRVTITLPDNQTTPGVVTSVGTVATSSAAGSGSGPGSSSGAAGSSSAGSGAAGSSGSSGAAADIEVDIKPTDPAATGTLTQAPVQITITTASVQHATVVPVDALLAQAKGEGEAGGGYAVEVAGPGDARHLVPVSLGMFDDADGLVQVTGSRLTAGERVVVPQL